MTYPACLARRSVLAAHRAGRRQLDGAFTLRATDQGDRVNLNLQYGDNGRSNYGRTFERSALADVAQSGDRITFALRRPAGSLRVRGPGHDRSRGRVLPVHARPAAFAVTDRTARDSRTSMTSPCSSSPWTTCRSPTSSSSRVWSRMRSTLPQLVRLINHGAGVRYIQAMTDAGFRKARIGRVPPRAGPRRLRRSSSQEMAGTRCEGAARRAGAAARSWCQRRLRPPDARRRTGREPRRAGSAPGITACRRTSSGGWARSVTGVCRCRTTCGCGDHGVTADFVEAVRAAGLQADRQRSHPAARSRRQRRLRPPRQGAVQDHANGGRDHPPAFARRAARSIRVLAALKPTGHCGFVTPSKAVCGSIARRW